MGDLNKKRKFKVKHFLVLISFFIIAALVSSNRVKSFIKNYIGAKSLLIIVLCFFILLYIYQKFIRKKQKFGENVYFAINYILILLIINLFFSMGLLIWFLILFPASILLFIRAFKMARAIKNNIEYKFLLFMVMWISHISHPKSYRAVMYSLFSGSIILFSASIFFLYLFIKSII